MSKAKSAPVRHLKKLLGLVRRREVLLRMEKPYQGGLRGVEIFLTPVTVNGGNYFQLNTREFFLPLVGKRVNYMVMKRGWGERKALLDKLVYEREYFILNQDYRTTRYVSNEAWEFIVAKEAGKSL